MSSPQLSILDAIQEGQRLRDHGIAAAAAGAENKHPGWKERCRDLFKEWVLKKPMGYQFFLEEFRLHIKAQKKLEQPDDNRSFAFLTQYAKKEGFIRSNGMGQRRDPVCHMSYATIWMVL